MFELPRQPSDKKMMHRAATPSSPLACGLDMHQTEDYCDLGDGFGLVPHQTLDARTTTSAFRTKRANTEVELTVLQELLNECDAKLAQDACNWHYLAIRGHAWMKLKHWDRAIEDFSKFLDQKPFDVHKRFSRGMAFFKNGQTSQAYDDFTRVLQLNPNHVMARYARASCFNTVGQFNHAIHEYTIALRKDQRENEKRLVLHLPKTKQLQQQQPQELDHQKTLRRVHFDSAAMDKPLSTTTTTRTKRKSKRRPIHKVTINLSEFAMPESSMPTHNDSPQGAATVNNVSISMTRPTQSPIQTCSSSLCLSTQAKAMAPSVCLFANANSSTDSTTKTNSNTTPLTIISVCATCGQQVIKSPHQSKQQQDITCAVTTATATTHTNAAQGSCSPNEKEPTKKKKIVVRHVTVAL